VAKSHEHALACSIGPKNDGSWTGSDLDRYPINDGSAVHGERDLLQVQRQHDSGLICHYCELGFRYSVMSDEEHLFVAHQP
jgi:hypothetical protein